MWTCQLLGFSDLIQSAAQPWSIPTFENISEVLVPLFVSMSPLTTLPIFLNMTEGMSMPDRRQLVRRAVLTAFIISMAIVLLGQLMFRFLGITVDDLRVAGGLILLLIAIYDLIFTRQRRKETEVGHDAGVVPLGTPLIIGPATMATCIVLADVHGKLVVMTALLINLTLITLLLTFSNRAKRYIRPTVSRAFGKVMSLFLAAIAVAMLRTGIAGLLTMGTY